MKIVRQLADWLLQNDRITPERYAHVMDAILDGVDADAGSLIDAAVDRRDRRESAEDASEEWWNLHGAGERARGKAARRRGGGGHPADTTPVKVWDLDPRLPGLLFPPGAAPDAFPLATLFLAVDKARGNRRAADWDGFAAAAAALYKAGGDELHDALRVAMEKRGRALGPLLAAMETGATLFPDGFLGGLSGESVTALRKRVDGGETAFSFVKKDWILRYPSFNVLNEACLVRNRLRRVYRLWVKTFSDWDEHGAANRGKPGVCLAFGKTLVHVPFGVWWLLQDPAAPRPGPLRGLAAFPDRSGFDWLNVRVDGKTVVLLGNDCVDPPDPPCGFLRIRGDGLETLPSPIQLLCPVVEPGRRTPVLALPDAPETALWWPQGWAAAMEEHRKLSNGVPAEDACPWRVLGEHLSVMGWTLLIGLRPDTVRGIPWKRLPPNCLDADDWSGLLMHHPEFADRAPWKAFSAEQLARVFSAQPGLAARFDWGELDGRTSYHILRVQPQFADHCDWSKLDGVTWSLLLCHQPQLADRCDWSKLDGQAWCLLLLNQPQFADRCDWSKLDGDNWRSLLRDKPQFAIHRPTPGP